MLIHYKMQFRPNFHSIWLVQYADMDIVFCRLGLVATIKVNNLTVIVRY
jgi:hypothetical protein